MPLLTLADTDPAVAGGRAIRLSGVPDFNADDPAFKITLFDGWFAVPEVDAVLVANGGGPGSVASGAWLSKEATYTLQGFIDTGRATLEQMRRLLIAALPADTDTPIICYGNDLAPDLQIYVRRFGKAEYPLTSRLDFTIPLVGADPYKYALEPLEGPMGVYTGEGWYETFALDSGAWVETYDLTAGVWHETYAQAVPSGPFPTSLVLDSPGDVTSRRVTGLAVGPLIAGEWWLLSETTGDRMGADITLAAGQAVAFDSFYRRATLNGEVITSLVFGDFLTLEPGLNQFRLVAGTQSAAYGGISAYPAYL